MNFSSSGRIKPAYLSLWCRSFSMLFLCLAYMLVYSWQKGQMEWLPGDFYVFVFFFTFAHVFVNINIMVCGVVWVFETATSENFYVTSEFHFWFEFSSVMYVWYTWDKINVTNFILIWHFTWSLQIPEYYQ